MSKSGPSNVMVPVQLSSTVYVPVPGRLRAITPLMLRVASGTDNVPSPLKSMTSTIAFGCATLGTVAFGCAMPGTMVNPLAERYVPALQRIHPAIASSFVSSYEAGRIEHHDHADDDVPR